jgi:orotidine-5'-phosphate decarboxylase
MAFADRLASALERSGSVACVGLDPVLEKLPAEIRARHHEPVAAIEEFCAGVIRAVAPCVGVIKPQSACFERFGHRGVATLERLCRLAREVGLAVVLDAKRGDIGISAEHYAAAAAGIGAHAITVSGYLGMSTVEPYLKAGLGVFVLVRTSNPGSDVIQSARLVDGRTSAEAMADEVARLGERYVSGNSWSHVGAVVGATKSAEGQALRTRMPRQMLLIPGFGAQGGTIDDVRTLVAPPPARAGDGWRAAVVRRQPGRDR